ncbi:MAG TPA: FHA domain-containing protein [Woeseiaceae bacterium]
MELSEIGLGQAPFPAHGGPVTHVSYEAEQAALEFLAEVGAHERALGLFQGPPLSGKTTILRTFTRSLDEHTAFALVDGAGAGTRELFDEILGQFGYEFEYTTVNELVSMLRVFVLQQTARGLPPLLIVENVHAMLPATLGALCELAALCVRDRCAVGLVFASDRCLEPMMRAPAVAPALVRREIRRFKLEPLTGFESRSYLYAKLKASGCREPAKVFPEDVCLELHEAAGGWPGLVDRLALRALAKAEKLPVTAELVERSDTYDNLPVLGEASGEWLLEDVRTPPTLIITRDGETLEERALDGVRFLIGRGEHNDLRINSRFVSRHHALLVRHGPTTFLLDLNSTNGTFVNSRRISNLVLRHEDVVQLGHHRIKFIDPQATERVTPDEAALAETVVMKSLADVRRLLAEERTEAVGAQDSSAAADG